MNGGDLTAFGRQPERLGADAEMRGRLGQVEPGLDPVRGGSVDWNMMVGTQRRHTLPRPAITVAGHGCGRPHSSIGHKTPVEFMKSIGAPSQPMVP